jgi:hypothetical protein
MKACASAKSLRLVPSWLSMKMFSTDCTIRVAICGSLSVWEMMKRLRVPWGVIRVFAVIRSIRRSRSCGVVARSSRSVARSTCSMFGRLSSVRCMIRIC